MHPNAGEECNSNIIKAHTIQRNGGLSRIAENGHVYSFFTDHTTMLKGGDLSANLVGVNNASTFTGFCSFHDDATFKPIEKNSFSPTEQHTFLLGYRAICKALFGKRAQLEMIPIHRESDKGRFYEEQVQWQGFLNNLEILWQRDIKNLNYHKSLYDKVLLSMDYSHVCFYVIQLGECPDFMCSGVTEPYCDFSGKQIRFRIEEIIDTVAFSVIATDYGGAVIFTWMSDSPICEKLVSSLDSLLDDAVPHAIVRFAFHYFDNIFVSPQWWDSLDDTSKQKLLIRQQKGGISDSSLSCLTDDGIRAVSWNVKKRVKRMKC